MFNLISDANVKSETLWICEEIDWPAHSSSLASCRDPWSATSASHSGDGSTKLKSAGERPRSRACSLSASVRSPTTSPRCGCYEVTDENLAISVRHALDDPVEARTWVTTANATDLSSPTNFEKHPGSIWMHPSPDPSNAMNATPCSLRRQQSPSRSP